VQLSRAQSAPRYARDISGGRLLLSDARTLSLFVNETRYRTFERLLGLPRDQANLATAIVLLATVEAIRKKTARMRAVPGPSFGDFALGTAAFKEVILGPPKPGVTEVPLFSGLVAIAAGGTLIVAIGKSTNGLRSASRAFVGRYGHHARRARSAFAGGARRLRTRG
jgi:hypothetical protein